MGTPSSYLPSGGCHKAKGDQVIQPVPKEDATQGSPVKVQGELARNIDRKTSKQVRSLQVAFVAETVLGGFVHLSHVAISPVEMDWDYNGFLS